MAKKNLYCEWCGGETKNKPTLISRIPIIEEIEEKIDKLGRQDVLDDYLEESIDADQNTRSEIYAYLDLTSDVRSRRICQTCLDSDYKNSEKYYSSISLDDEIWDSLVNRINQEGE